MIGLDKAQRAYDRMEPEDDCSDDQDHVLYAEQLTDREVKLFAIGWLDDANHDESSLHFKVISAWVYDYPLSYDLQKYAEKFARQAAFEDQLPPNLKRQASI